MSFLKLIVNGLITLCILVFLRFTFILGSSLGGVATSLIVIIGLSFFTFIGWFVNKHLFKGVKDFFNEEDRKKRIIGYQVVDENENKELTPEQLKDKELRDRGYSEATIKMWKKTHGKDK